MTQKELAYVEDSIGHESNIIKICTETVNNLQDENLINYINNQKEGHLALKEKLMNMLEGKVNE